MPHGPGGGSRAAPYLMGPGAAGRSVVTGAFSYTGKYITERLLARGERVTTLTGHPLRPHSFGDRVSMAPYLFERPAELARVLEGATTLYNTYWIRFPAGGMTFEAAVTRSLTLIRAAEEAGVRRIVHVSITHASEASPLAYFRGKGRVEAAIRCSRLSWAILRPTVIFGREDVLINNIAWCLRRFPVFALIGSGEYPIQPVFVEDVADLAVRTGQQRENLTVDVVGPERFTFRDLVRLIARTVRSRATVMPLPPRLAFSLVTLLGYLVRDVVLTWEEVQGLMAGLLCSDSAPAGQVRLSAWLDQTADTVGTRYASELERHYR